MVLLLFPAVAVATPVLVWAAVGIFADEILCLPVGAGHRLVTIFLWFSSQVLPIVCVDALLLVMLEGKRTPGGLEIEHVEVCVLRHQVQEVDRQLAFVMCECAEQSTILTRVEVVRVRLTEFGLVLLWVVKLFDSIMRVLAAVAKRALVVHRGIGDMPAHD